jgi:hypothetical protein
MRALWPASRILLVSDYLCVLYDPPVASYLCKITYACSMTRQSRPTCVRFEAFTASNVNKVFSGYQPHQLVKMTELEKVLLNHLTQVVHPQSFGARIMKFLITQFSTVSCHVLYLRSKYSPQHIVLKHTQLMFFTHERDQVSHPYNRMSETSVLYILIFMCFGTTINYKKKTCTEW